ncbi:hypothetical protein [Actinoplanes sp. NPDC026623]|uniref:hypothetical protein n=1 Tax=Actinoplanes sp. NPDC026623 TaxID=3155610 RepID=UPI0033DDD6D9
MEVTPSAEEIEEEAEHEVPLRAGSSTLTRHCSGPRLQPQARLERARAVAREVDEPL